MRSLAFMPLSALALLLACGGSGGGSTPASAPPSAQAGAMHLYTRDSAGLLQAWDVDTGSGALRAVPAGALADTLQSLGKTVSTMAFSPDGDDAYVVSPLQGLLTCKHDPATGKLTPDSPWTSMPSDPTAIALDPAGRFAYLTDQDETGLAGYSLRGADGPVRMDAPPNHMDNADTFLSGWGGANLAVHPSGRFLFMPDTGIFSDDQTGRVWTYALDASGRPAGDAKITDVGVNTRPSMVLPSPDGRFLYALANGLAAQATIITYRVDRETGALTRAAAAPDLSLDKQIASLLMEPGGHFIIALVPGLGIAGEEVTSRASMQVLKVDAATGALSATGDPVYLDFNFGIQAVMDARTRTMAVFTDSFYISDITTIWTAVIDPATGALTISKPATLDRPHMPLALR